MRNLGFYIDSFWGTLGFLDTSFPMPVELLGLGLITVTAVCECLTCRPDMRPGLKRLWIIPGLLISFVGIFVSMYLFHTPLTCETG